MSKRLSPGEYGERLRRSLDELRSLPDDVAPDRWQFRKAAALLSWFDPTTLKPAGEVSEEGVHCCI